MELRYSKNKIISFLVEMDRMQSIVCAIID